MKSHVLLESYCKALKLPTVAREYGRLARQCGPVRRYAAPAPEVPNFGPW